jgi:prolyl oligopeptidase
MTGANDPRVAPQNSRKMAARMQAANASEEPILLRTSATTGTDRLAAVGQERGGGRLVFVPVQDPRGAVRAGGDALP